MAASAEGRREAPEALRLRDAYLAALLAADIEAARRVIADALDAGTPARRLYLEVLQPALYEVGMRWSRAEISVAQEHLATAATQSNLTWLSERLLDGERAPRGRVLVACAEDELHMLGVRMVADFLEAEGWEITFVGAMTPPEGLVELAARRRRRRHLRRAAGADPPGRARGRRPARRAEHPVHRRRRPGVRRLGERALRTGADAWARDAQDAVRVLDARFAA